MTQSAFIRDISSKHEQLKEQLAELQAAYAKLLAGNRREQFINPDQQLLEFPDDPELQAALEVAKREAEQEIVKITYTRRQKRKSKPRSDSFPSHLRRVEVTVASSPGGGAGGIWNHRMLARHIRKSFEISKAW